ncbi:hypothetical protein NMU03_09285 [Allocoprobacillus halotolerans]|uniref:Uncharacterized protein n=1 Tax=Allocoprobacillus halotolerans TaxID=2944914 RepID=A0ABY5HYL7_9FIRM|nr:hypothetical protein [Allocoprobacillus halotolerans]UTY37910.1 hypothetical protein NMU03_09285 [Allocoprobacillus halotolerans]
MKVFIKIFTVFLLMGCLFACEQGDVKVSLERDGNLYEVTDLVSFYYPKDFQLDANHENQKDVRFIKDDASYIYATIIDDTDNVLEELPQLYEGQLEEDGAIDIYFQRETIPSGISCYEFTGTYQATGMKFVQMVYFTEDASYVYSYQAPEKVYEDQIDIVKQYLESLTVHH